MDKALTFVGDHAIIILRVAAGSQDVIDFLLFKTLTFGYF